MKFYHRIRDLREDSDKTQADIALVLNTSSSYYSQYENGKRQVPFERVVELAKYYSVSLDYIAGLTDKKHSFKEWDKI